MKLTCDLRIAKGDFDLTVALEANGTRFGLFGPSGAGKTSLVRTFAGLDSAHGRLIVDGEAWLDSERSVFLPPHARRTGWVPQDNALLPHLNVHRNLMFSGRAEVGLVNLVVETLDLQALLQRPVAKLSGGEAKRVAIGRALLSQPRLLLLDEPLAGLDWRMKHHLLGFLLKVQKRFETPLVFVSHDPVEIGRFCDEVWFLHGGRLEAQGTPEQVFLRPESEAAALVAGIENRWIARVLHVASEANRVKVGDLTLQADFDGLPGQDVVAMVPAVEILLSRAIPTGTSARNLWPGVVTGLEHRVHGILVHVACGATSDTEAIPATTVPLSVLITPAAFSELQLQKGERVCALFKASAVSVFPL